MAEKRVAEAIDRSSSLPYYAQLRDTLKGQIQSGAWAPGDLLPSESEMCVMYDVSRSVVRQALQALEQEGIIYRHRGKGSFVAEPKIHETLVQKLTGFHQDMMDQGHVVVNQVLRQEVVPANADVAKYLNVAQDSPVIICERLRFVDGKPVNLSISHVPYARCQELLHADLRNQSLYAVIERACGQRIMRGTRIIEATAPPEHVAELLGIDDDLPVFNLKTVCYLEDDTPIEYALGFHRSDRSRFKVELIRYAAAEEPLEEGSGHVEPETLPESFTLIER